LFQGVDHCWVQGAAQLALQMGLQLAPINNHINTYDAQSGLVNV